MEFVSACFRYIWFCFIKSWFESFDRAIQLSAPPAKSAKEQKRRQGFAIVWFICYLPVLNYCVFVYKAFFCKPIKIYSVKNFCNYVTVSIRARWEKITLSSCLNEMPRNGEKVGKIHCMDEFYFNKFLDIVYMYLSVIDNLNNCTETILAGQDSWLGNNFVREAEGCR